MNALLDFLDNELEFGNMYPLGKKVCTWYAAWKSIAFSRMKNAELAFKCVRQSLESLGAFSEVYEINEDNKISRPWFTTAAGVFASAVNEMLMQSDGENIYIFPAVPLEFTDAEFKLLVKGGAVAEIKISDNSVEKLKLDFLPGVKEKKFNIFFRGERIS